MPPLARQLFCAALVAEGAGEREAAAWRFVEAAYLSEPGDRTPAPGEAPMTMLAPAWLLVAACVWFGLDTSWSVGGAQRAAALLLGDTP